MGIFRLSFYKPFLSRTLHPHHLSRHKRVYSSASIFCNLAIPLATNKMSEIPKKQTQTAPTPQNTPANNAPISSHAQQPGVGTIKEEEFDRAAAASIFAQNPKLVQMIQGKLGSLVGRSSGDVELQVSRASKRSIQSSRQNSRRRFWSWRRNTLPNLPRSTKSELPLLTVLLNQRRQRSRPVRWTMSLLRSRRRHLMSRVFQSSGFPP